MSLEVGALSALGGLILGIGGTVYAFGREQGAIKAEVEALKARVDSMERLENEVVSLRAESSRVAHVLQELHNDVKSLLVKVAVLLEARK